MKLLESAEMYLETIYVLQERNGKVKSVDVANELNYSKASVSIAMKQLRENNYITFNGDNSISLLPTGLEVAIAVYEKHVFLTKALIKMGVDPITASQDACRMEHVISKETLEALKSFVEEK